MRNLAFSRDLSRLSSLEVEEALVHMMAVAGCVILIFLLAALILKGGLILIYKRVLHQDLEVGMLLLLLC